jgi:TonB family protein
LINSGFEGFESKIMNANSSKTFLLALVIFYLMAGILSWSSVFMPTANAQTAQTPQTQSSTRKLKLSAPPEYPELARKMNIQGVARVLLTVNPEGKVVGVKELGGNPVLVAALSQAVRKWKYEPADRESEIEVRFEFTQSH